MQHINILWLSCFLLSLIAAAFVVRPLLQTTIGNRNHFRMAIIVLLCLPLITILLYWQLGASNNLQKWYVAKQQVIAAEKMRAQLGSVEQVIIALQQHLAKDPKSAKGWYLLGRLYLSLNQVNNAVAVFNKAYQLAPDDQDISFQYAQALYLAQHNLQGQPQKILEKILTKDPHNIAAINLYAVAAYQTGQYQKAIAYWEQLLPLYPADSSDGAALLEMIGKAQKALAKQV